MHPEPIWNAHGLRFAKMMDYVFERKSSEIANLMSPDPSPAVCLKRTIYDALISFYFLEEVQFASTLRASLIMESRFPDPFLNAQ